MAPKKPDVQKNTTKTPGKKPTTKLLASTGSEPQDSISVAKVPPRSKVQVGKPHALKRTTQMRMAFTGGGLGNGAIADASGGNFYSPELSTDFLELPQSLSEKWNTFRFFYDTNPFVGQAIDLHTELPLSKIRINIPKAENRELALEATRFCEKWAREVKLLHRLIAVVHEYFLIGEVFIFAEDVNPEIPEELLFRIERSVEDDEDGNPILYEEKVPLEDMGPAQKWLKRNYKGWTSLRCLPPDSVQIESFNYTDKKMMELVPDGKTKKVIMQAASGDARAQRIVDDMPPDVVAAVRAGENIALGMDPDAGSFCYYMANKKSDYAPRGKSILERCLRTLTQFDKLRQANASIASRHMTPHRIVWAENMSIEQVDQLRDQVDQSLMDPDFSIVSNYQINWEEMGSDQRLLDLTSEMEMTNRELAAGLGVTESLLTGESSYSGDKISLEVINTRYMLLRELLQDFVEEYLFKPMCRRMGFMEIDQDGFEVVLYPKLSFTRLALRDNADTFDALFNLYSKGSVDVDVILELLNIDPVATKEKLHRDLFTQNDALFNEALRAAYSAAGQAIGDPKQSDFTEKIAKNLGVTYTPPPEEGGGRF